MNLVQRIIVSAGFLLSGASLSFADHTVGSGGDAVRVLFEQARMGAVARLDQIKWCSFDSSTSPDLIQWILKVRLSLQQDIRASNHLWVVDSQPTCAYTEHKPGAPLYLSYPTCINSVQTDLTKALFVVLHEGAHHMGVADEKQADLVATTILRALPQNECPSLPNDPFNPQICTGPALTNEDLKHYFSPGESEVYIGNYSLYSRFRSCTQMTGCGDWQSGELSLSNYPALKFQNFKMKVKTLAGGFRTSLFSTDIPNFLVLFDGDQLEKMTLMPRYGGSFSTINQATHKQALIDSLIRFDTSGGFNRDCIWFRNFKQAVVDKTSGIYTEAETILTGRH